MLVHRDTDEKSDGEQPTDLGRPQPAAQNPAADASGDGTAESLAPSEADASRDDGKTHLIGDALKSVYQRTLEEDVPDDFLDLLKQLK